MGLINKHSATPGAQPNLVPGTLGVNTTDELIFFRAHGRVQSVSLAKLRTAPPAEGAYPGAPLQRTADGLRWAPELTPSSVVEGRTAVDPPTMQNMLAVPGVSVLGLAADHTFTPGTVLAERFYVASDAILVDRIGAFVRDQGIAGPIILGIFDASLQAVIQTRIAQPLMGNFNSISVGFTIPRGYYYGVVWSATAVTYAAVETVREEAGVYVSASDRLEFEVRKRAGALDEPNGLRFEHLAVQTDYQETPNIPRVTLLRWAEALD